MRPALTRREFLRLAAGLQGLGLCGCALAANSRDKGLGQPGPAQAEAVDLASGPRYNGPLIDCHSHVILRTPPGSGVSGLDETSLVRALQEAGVESVVGFGAGPGRTEGGRLVPVWAASTGLPVGRDLPALLADRLYRGLKVNVRHFPFPMQPQGFRGQADDKAVQGLAAVAAEARVPLTLHLDGPDVEDLGRLCAAYPEAPIIWAHAGTTPPQFGGGATSATVRRMLDTHPNLHIDLSARAPGWMGPLGSLEPGKPLLPAEWAAIMTRHPSRVLFGIDLFLTRFLPSLPRAVAYWRRALGELPPASAEQCAHQNARRLYRL